MTGLIFYFSYKDGSLIHFDYCSRDIKIRFWVDILDITPRYPFR